MSKHRLLSMLFYGVAALVGSALMAIFSITAVIAVALVRGAKLGLGTRGRAHGGVGTGSDVPVTGGSAW